MNLRGIYPPIATPFRAGDEALDLDAVRFNADRWMATGLRGLVVLGTNGEAGVVDDEEAVRLIETVRERTPRDRLLIAGTGRDSTLATIRATRHAAAAGADLALVRAPSLFKSQMTADAFVRHFAAVADASPVPVLLYTFPQAFGVSIPIGAVKRLSEHPNVIGMKDSGGDLTQIAEEIDETPSGFQVMVGSAPSLFASLCVGATGGIVAVANVIPDLCVKLLTCVDDGDHRGACAVQRAIAPLAKAVTSGFGVAGLKMAMTLAGYRGGVPRAPLSPASEAATEHLRRLLKELGPFLDSTEPA